MCDINELWVSNSVNMLTDLNFFALIIDAGVDNGKNSELTNSSLTLRSII